MKILKALAFLLLAEIVLEFIRYCLEPDIKFTMGRVK